MQLSDLRRFLTVAAAVPAVVLIAVSVIAAARHAGVSAPASVPAPLAAGSALSRPRAVPALRLVDAQGRAVSARSWRGRWASLSWLAQIEGMPTTIFVGPTGRVRAVHTGQYQTEATLADDIARYAG